MPKRLPDEVLAKDARLGRKYWMENGREVTPLEVMGDSVRCSARLVEGGPKTRKYVISAKTRLFSREDLVPKRDESGDVKEAPPSTPARQNNNGDRRAGDAGTRVLGVLAASRALELALNFRRTEAYGFLHVAISADRRWRVLVDLLAQLEADLRYMESNEELVRDFRKMRREE